MNVPQNPSPAGSPVAANNYPLRWEGAMNDGNGTSGTPGAGAILCANAEEIWLSGRRGDFHLPRNSVVRIGRAGMYPWFFRGVRIRHRIPAFPSILQFGPWTVPSREILAQLKSLGFPTG